MNSSFAEPAHKVLVVLDVKGVLVESIHRTRIDTYYPLKTAYNFITPNGFYVFQRPYTNCLLELLFQKFDVAIWSSMSEDDLQYVIHQLFSKDQIESLKFVFSQKDCFVEKDSQCLRTIRYKKLAYDSVLELAPYENKTILLDVSPFKCKYNPMFTSIHPQAYRHQAESDDELKFVTRYLQTILQTMEYTHQFDVPKYLKMYPYVHLLSVKDANNISPLRNRNRYRHRAIYSRKRKSMNMSVVIEEEASPSFVSLSRDDQDIAPVVDITNIIQKCALNVYQVLYDSITWLFKKWCHFPRCAKASSFGH